MKHKIVLIIDDANDELDYNTVYHVVEESVANGLDQFKRDTRFVQTIHNLEQMMANLQETH